MTNKEKLKKAIEQDLNSNFYYEEIIKKIKESDEMKKKNKNWKWTLAPVCLLIIISGILILNYQEMPKIAFKNKSYLDNENNIILNINEIQNNQIGAPKLDADVKIVNEEDNFILPFKEVNIPQDLKEMYKFKIFTKENIDSKDYNILHNYEIGYTNGLDKTITISYSEKYQPLRDYYFNEEGEKITTINGIDLKIYKFEDIYFTNFKHNGYNFDIETSKISEQELSNFLISILK